MNGEADLAERLPNNLNVDEVGSTRFRAGEARIGKGLRHEGKGAPRQAPNRNSTVAIWTLAGWESSASARPVRIEPGLASAALHFLGSGVVTH